MRRAASGAQPANQPLRHHGAQRGGEQERFHAEIAQAGDGAGGIIGVQRRQHEVARQCRLHGDAGGFGIADFADHHHIGILPQDGAQAGGKAEADLGVHLRLAEAIHGIFHRVFHGQDIAAAIVEQFQPGIECRRLAAARGAGHQHQAVGFGEAGAERPFGAFGHAERGQIDAGIFLVEQAQHHALTAARRQGGDAHIEPFAAQRQIHAAILRQASFGNVQPRHHLDAADQNRRHTGGQAVHFPEFAIGAHPHHQRAFERLDVNVRGFQPGGFGDQPVDQADGRRFVVAGQQILGGWQIVTEAGQFIGLSGIGGAGIMILQQAIKGGIVHLAKRQRAAGDAAHFGKRLGLAALAARHFRHVTQRGDDHPLRLGKGIGEGGLAHGLGGAGGAAAAGAPGMGAFR